MLTFIAPFVAIALNDIPVKKVHEPQKATNKSASPIPDMPTILNKNDRDTEFNNFAMKIITRRLRINTIPFSLDSRVLIQMYSKSHTSAVKVHMWYFRLKKEQEINKLVAKGSNSEHEYPF